MGNEIRRAINEIRRIRAQGHARPDTILFPRWSWEEIERELRIQETPQLLDCSPDGRRDA